MNELPHDDEIEKAVLGAIILENESLEEVLPILRKPTDFYDPKHQLIYKAIIDMYNADHKIDMLTITSWLRKAGLLKQAGGPVYVVELTQRVNSAAHISTHAKILAELAIGRGLENLALAIQRRNGKKEDFPETLELAGKELYELEGVFFAKEPKTILELSKEVIKSAEVASKTTDGIIGERTFINAVDEFTKGFIKQNLIIIAARPGMGKSSLAHTILRNKPLIEKKPVALFSLEMSAQEVTSVLHAHQTGIDYELIRSGGYQKNHYTLDSFHKKIGPLMSAPIYIDDTPAISITELRAKCRRLVLKHGVQLIIVDYLQLMTVITDNKSRITNREQEISTISRGLKAMAKELNVPVIALSQLSRECEKRADKRPQLSDLRDSGAIEQDADMVAFLWRPSYYGFDTDEAGNAIPKYLNKIIIAKYRAGSLGDIDTMFIGRIKQFADLQGGEHSVESTSEKRPSFDGVQNNFEGEYFNDQNT